MSAEDEALMWDILDFSSSCCSADINTTRLGDLVPSMNQDRINLGSSSEAMEFSGIPPSPLPMEEGIRGRNRSGNGNGYQRDPSVTGTLPSPPSYGRVPEGITEDSIPGWPLTDGNGNSGIDIPDWLILGSMVEHL